MNHCLFQLLNLLSRGTPQGIFNTVAKDPQAAFLNVCKTEYPHGMWGAENSNNKSQDLAVSTRRPPPPRQARRQLTPTSRWSCLERGSGQHIWQPLQPLPLFSSCYKTPGSLSADTALGCLGGNSRSLGEVEAGRGTAMALLLTHWGALMGSHRDATPVLAALPTPHSHTSYLRTSCVLGK